MDENKEYKSYSQLLKDIDSLKNDILINDRDDILFNIKELCEIAYKSLGLETTIKSENTRWVLLKDGEDKYNGAIFTDLSQIVPHTKVSYKTLLRRAFEYNNDFTINGYHIMNLPYFKSKRGPNNGNQ